MFLHRFYDEGLAQASYLVGCQATGEAIVIDPARHTEPYRQVAKSQGLRITAVTETHIHADFVSGSRQLAWETDARMYLSGEGGKDWSYAFAGEAFQIVADGDVIRIGNLSLEVMHTPGHTPEHISFVLTDHPASDQPMGVFTGDFVFVGDVGRPDLLERAAGFRDTMREGASKLFHSLLRFAKLPDHLQIWPGHGAGSACGKALGAVPSSVLGFEKLSNWAFRVTDEEEFVKEILQGQPEPPSYFAQMKRVNKAGPAIRENRAMAISSPQRLKDIVKRGELLVDLRPAESFAEGHVDGSLFLPSGKPLVTWAGWTLGYEADFYLLLPNEGMLEETLRSLRSIGLDRVAGVFLDSSLAGLDDPLRKSRRVEADAVDYRSEPVIDVRGAREFEEGHVAGARHIHLGHLKDHLDEIPEQPTLHCRSGTRSLIASSILERAGKDPRDILGGYLAIAALQPSLA